MVRKSGNRKRAVTEAILAEIVNSAEIDRKDEKGVPLDQDAYYELLYFNENREKQYVSFQLKHSVKLSIIDLCAYQQDGKAKLNIDNVWWYRLSRQFLSKNKTKLNSSRNSQLSFQIHLCWCVIVKRLMQALMIVKYEIFT